VYKENIEKCAVSSFLWNTSIISRSVGGVSENGVLPLVFFSVVGIGIGRLSVIVGSL
jgi:hypothetical protein